MGPANLPDRAATSGQADEDRLDDLDVQEESATLRCHTAAALMRDGGQPRAVWLSALDGVVATGRLESERQAHLPVAQGGAIAVRTKQRRKMARRQRGSMATAAAPNQYWNMDFVSDKLADERSFRIQTVVDQFTRECVCLQADRAMTGMHVAQALERAKLERRKLPASITVVRVPTYGRATAVLVDGKLSWDGSKSGAPLVKSDAFETAPSDRSYVYFDGVKGSHTFTQKKTCAPLENRIRTASGGGPPF